MEKRFWMVWRDKYLLMNIFKWNRPRVGYGKFSAMRAVEMDYVEFFEYTSTDEIEHDYYKENALGLAIQHNSVRVEEWILANHASARFWVIDWAVNKEDIPMLRELHARGYTGTIFTMYNAARSGNLKVIKYLYEYGYPITKGTVRAAHTHYYTEMIDFVEHFYRPSNRKLSIKLTEFYPQTVYDDEITNTTDIDMISLD